VIVSIPRAVIDEMIAHARDDAPNECCGLLVGVRGEVSGAVRARNLEPSPTRYLIDPVDYLAAIKAARARAQHVIGAYHSHPDGTTTPSRRDIDEATGGRDFLYVIVSPASGAITAYFVRNGEALFAGPIA
jgi:proteasome lid subunit RPN8/RPN11